MFIKRSKKFFWVAAGFLFYLPRALVLATNHDIVTNTSATIPNPLGRENDTLFKFITLLLDTVFPIASVVAIFFLIYSGFKMVMAGGNEDKLSEAKTALLWTVIGIAILLGAKVLSAVVCGTIEQLGTAGLTCPTP
ncbi:MAG: hypothetical protein HYV67_01920 [Candidatus Taylorbacteria bacterium]|nr:hypothetical protein [Candidatus Taylorbacteria bacterium]